MKSIKSILRFNKYNVEAPKEKSSNENRFPGKTWTQVYAIITASLTMLLVGTLYAWPSPAIPKLLSPQYNVTIEEASYLTIIPPIAMVVSTPLFCFLLDKIGRKYNLILMVVIDSIALILIAFANSITIFYVSRGFTGMGDACAVATIPVYIAECVTPRIRGLYGNAMMIFMFLGQFLVNLIGYYTTIQTCAFILMSIPILFFLTFSFMPETPYFYAMKDDQDNARKSLQKLRGIEDVDGELQQITADVQRQMSEPSKFSDLWNIKSNRKAVIIANLARGFQQSGGLSGLVVYTQYIFELAGGAISSGHSAMIFSGLLTTANVFANAISDKLGRKKSMSLSCIGCSISLFGVSTFFYLQTDTEVDVSNITWFPLVGLACFIVSFASGLGVVPNLLLGEIFSTAIRSKAGLTTNITFACYLMAVNKLFQYLMTTYGLWVPFLFFSICMFFSAIASYFIIPETKGKTIEEIQQMLKGNDKISK